MNVKYAYLVFSIGFPFPEVENPFKFDDRTELRAASIKDQVEGPDSKHWPEWVGSLQWEALCRCKLVLTSWMPTDNPEVVDGENEELRSKVLGIFRVLPLVAALTPPFEDCFLISGKGTFANGELKASDLRSFSRVNKWTRAYYNEHQWNEFTEWAKDEVKHPTLLNRWKTTFDHFHRLLETGTNNRQLVECFRSFEEAVKTTQLEFKIPNLVRALECVIDCYGYKQFSQRVLYLLGQLPASLPFSVSTNLATVLEDLYQVRNDCSHGKPFAYSIEKKYAKPADSAVVAKFEFVAEWAARQILNDSFVNQTILQATTDRDTLVTAWKTGSIKPI